MDNSPKITRKNNKIRKGTVISSQKCPNSSDSENNSTMVRLKRFRNFFEIKRPHAKHPSTAMTSASDLVAKDQRQVDSDSKTSSLSKYKRCTSFRETTSSTSNSAPRKCNTLPKAVAADSLYDNAKINELTHEFGDKLELRQNKKFENNAAGSTFVELTSTNDKADAALNQSNQIEEQLREINRSITELNDFLDDSNSRFVNTSTCKKSDDEEDEFGLISLDENCDDNYIVEAYNDDDNELVITILDISRKSIKLDESSRGCVADLIHGSDMVFHQREDAADRRSFKLIKNLDYCEEEESVQNRISTATTDDSGFERDNTYSSNNSDDDDNNSDGASITSRHFYSLHNSFRNTRCQTITDDQGNVRIRKVCSVKDNENEEHNIAADDQLKSKLSYIIEELQDTEQQYVAGLYKIVCEYKPYLEINCPGHMLGKTSYIFANIDAIYDESQKFCKLIKQAGEDTNKIAEAFISSTIMLQLYPKYSKNKPTCDSYIKEFDQVIKKRQQELGDRLDLSSYLLTPIQRLGKYILILENIRKELKKLDEPSDHIAHALDIIKKQMKIGNDSIAIDSIKNCPINLLNYGSFLMREKFNVIKPRRIEAMLFMFQDIVVITHIIAKNLEEFNYFESIKMSDISIVSFETEPLIFQLSDYLKCKRGQSDQNTFVLEAKSSKIKLLWTESIEKRLWDQLEKCRQQQKEQLHDIQQDKRYSSADLLKRRKKKKDTIRTKSVGSSKFYN